MKVSTTTIILRSILGLIFLVFGLNHFFAFLPMPAMQGPAASFIGALAASGYMLALVSGTQVLAAAMLLIGVLVPLALVILAPIIVNIVAFHAFLDPSGLPQAVVVTVLELILAWQYREAFAPLFR
jgi:putative oxidoreductase